MVFVPFTKDTLRSVRKIPARFSGDLPRPVRPMLTQSPYHHYISSLSKNQEKEKFWAEEHRKGTVKLSAKMLVYPARSDPYFPRQNVGWSKRGERRVSGGILRSRVRHTRSDWTKSRIQAEQPDNVTGPKEKFLTLLLSPFVCCPFADDG